MKDFTKILSIIIICAAALLLGSHLLDYYSQTPDEGRPGLFYLFRSIEPDAVRSYIGSLAEVITALFGILITVVAIIVNLSANRYTSKIIDLFINDIINVAVLILFAVIIFYGIWITNAAQGSQGSGGFSPRYGIIIYLSLISVGVLIIVPYFFYVFHFLNPSNIINKIKDQAYYYLAKANKAKYDRTLKSGLIENIDRLSELCKGSLLSSDQTLGLHSVKAMNNILIRYISAKQDDSFHSLWQFDIQDFFLGLDPDIVEDLEAKQYWFEYKVLQEYESILIHFLEKNPRITYQVAVNTTEIGMSLRDEVVLDLLRRYFNTYLKRCIEKKHAQNTINVFYQYYLFLKYLIEHGVNDRLCLQMAEYFKYYGQAAALDGMENVLEYSSYFLRKINEVAYKKYDADSDLVEQHLNLFLTVDDFPDDESTEKALLGVRANQAILASFYMQRNNNEFVRRIREDMKDEPPDRLQLIEETILREEEEHHFEIDNIGINMLYVPAGPKNNLRRFFELFTDENQATRSVNHEQSD